MVPLNLSLTRLFVSQNQTRPSVACSLELSVYTSSTIAGAVHNLSAIDTEVLERGALISHVTLRWSPVQLRVQ